MKTDCSQKQLLNRIDQVSFAVNDMTLYLDTHPCDEKALTYCHELVQERKKLLKEYAEAYGPLIIDITDQTGESIWKWMEQPLQSGFVFVAQMRSELPDPIGVSFLIYAISLLP